MWGERKAWAKVGRGGRQFSEFRLGSSMGLGPLWEIWRLEQEQAKGQRVLC